MKKLVHVFVQRPVQGTIVFTLKGSEEASSFSGIFKNTHASVLLVPNTEKGTYYEYVIYAQGYECRGLVTKEIEKGYCIVPEYNCRLDSIIVEDPENTPYNAKEAIEELEERITALEEKPEPEKEDTVSQIEPSFECADAYASLKAGLYELTYFDTSGNSVGSDSIISFSFGNAISFGRSRAVSYKISLYVTQNIEGDHILCNYLSSMFSLADLSVGSVIHVLKLSEYPSSSYFPDEIQFTVSAISDYTVSAVAQKPVKLVPRLTLDVTTGSGTTISSFVNMSCILDTVDNKITAIPQYEGATTFADGTDGLVPAATSAEKNMFLKGDGTWYDLNTDIANLKLRIENLEAKLNG